MNILAVVFCFVGLIIVSIIHAIHERKVGFNAGFNSALDKFENDSLYKLSDVINPIVVKATCTLRKEKIDEYRKNYKPTDRELMEFLSKDSDQAMMTTILKQLQEKNLIYKEISLEQNGDMQVDYALVLTENKNNFYKQMFYSDSYETRKRQSN